MTDRVKMLAEAHALEQTTGRVAIVKKHPDGYYCLYDSKGKRPLNCWDKRHKEKPSDEVVQKAERTVQFWKHQ